MTNESDVLQGQENPPLQPNWRVWAMLALTFFGILSLVLLLVQPGRNAEARSAQDIEPDRLDSGIANCRYGVAAHPDPVDQVQYVDDFGAGWYLNFKYHASQAENGAEYIPVVWVSQDKDQQGNYLPTYTIAPSLNDGGLGPLLQANPGRLWIVGNEPDRGPDPGLTSSGQGDSYPDVYAQAYHDVYHYVKSVDPTAQVANAGLVEVTPGRLQYLDLVWQAYIDHYGATMPIDVWTMHVYILPEVKVDGSPSTAANVALGTDPALGKRESGLLASQCPLDEVYCYAEHDDMEVFKEQVIAMRTWMRDHGQRQKPLLITEYSLIYPYVVNSQGVCTFLIDEYGNCFTPERVAAFMVNSFNYLAAATDNTLGYSLDGNRLVQQWLWFSIHRTTVGYASNLVKSPFQPVTFTPAGQTLINTTASLPLDVNLIPDRVGYPAVPIPGGSTTADATLTLTFRNNGNTSVSGPFDVTFYADQALSQPIGTFVVPPPSPDDYGVTGCSTRAHTVSVLWQNLSAGRHDYWVKLDSGNDVAEKSEADNVAHGFVLVGPSQVALPVLIHP